MCQLWIPPKWCRYLGYMSYTTWVIAIFVLIFAHFRYYGNRGRSEQFLTVTFNQGRSPKPLLDASIWVIYYVRRVIATFVLKFGIFRYHGNRVGLSKLVWQSQMCRLWIPPNWCKYLGYIILYNLSYNQFYAEICKFSLPWQQGSVWAISDCHL